MRLKLLSPGEMSAEQKPTTSRSPAARRPAGAGDGLAQQPGNGPACTRLGGCFANDVSAKTFGDRDPRHRAALDRALQWYAHKRWR
jgi:hypothetical protein